MNKPSKIPGRPRSEAVNQAILQATLNLLAEAGYPDMSMEAIAARAGVGKATLYRRYTCKDEVVAAAIDDVLCDPSLPDTGSFWGDMNCLIEEIIEMSCSDLGRQTIALLLSTASSSPQFAQIYRTKYIFPRRKELEEIFNRAKTRGEIQADLDASLIFDLIAGSVFYTLIFNAEAEQVDMRIRRSLQFLLNQAEGGENEG
jgi:AcrR family transcriptional regulator